MLRTAIQFGAHAPAIALLVLASLSCTTQTQPAPTLSDRLQGEWTLRELNDQPVAFVDGAIVLLTSGQVFADVRPTGPETLRYIREPRTPTDQRVDAVLSVSFSEDGRNMTWRWWATETQDVLFHFTRAE